MSDNTSIEWTATPRADGTMSPGCTFNPWEGCSKVSPGCAHCYAEARAKRFGTVKWGPQGNRRVASEAYWRQPVKWDREAKAAGGRRRVFCASLADVFEGPEAMSADSFQAVDRARERLWATVWCTPHLDWLLLTKRPENVAGPEHHFWAPGATANAAGWVRRMAGAEEAQRFYSGDWPPPNVWLGVSVEDQQRADERIPLLLQTPAAVRFLSCEPLLGPVDLRHWLYQGKCPCCDSPCLLGRLPDCYGCGCPGATRDLNWVIIGGESGGGARPCNVDWARSLVAQCRAACVAVFVKQLGSDPWDGPEPGDSYADGSPRHERTPLRLRDRKGGDPAEWEEGLRVREWPSPATRK